MALEAEVDSGEGRCWRGKRYSSGDEKARKGHSVGNDWGRVEPETDLDRGFANLEE